MSVACSPRKSIGSSHNGVKPRVNDAYGQRRECPACVGLCGVVWGLQHGQNAAFNASGSMTAIILYRIDDAKRMRRYYRMDVQPSVFGEWCLMREWGRIGST